jgi:hypothetical protein
MKLKRINLTSSAENKALWDLLKGCICLVSFEWATLADIEGS